MNGFETPAAEEREQPTDTQEWNEAMDADVKLYTGPTQLRKDT